MPYVFPKLYKVELRACLKRDDSQEMERVELGYEKEPTVSDRSD